MVYCIMLSEFRKFVGFKILEYFLTHPREEAYLKEIAKKLQVNPASVKNYCDIFEKEGLIKKKIKGNLHLFSTNNENFCIREMKKAYISSLLNELKIEKISENAISIAIYGSYASGDYDEKSDLDILIIGEEKDVKKEYLLKIMKKIGKEIQLTIIRPVKWEEMKRKNDPFVKSVLRNHILIKGVEL